MNDTTLPRRGDLARFAGVDAWVFDLDNTLYPRQLNLFAQVDVRIRDYVARLLGVAPDEAQRVQKDYYRRYGTTLRGLMEEHAIRPEDFLAYVHDIDHSRISADPRLGAAIDRLPGRKFIFTNGSRAHAEAVTDRLGITGSFEDVFDIGRAEMLPKPNRETYDRFVRLTGVAPERGAMFEDLSRNLLVPHDLGMATVLIAPEDPPAIATADDWETEGRDAPYVDFVIDDLAGFLEDIRSAARPRR